MTSGPVDRRFWGRARGGRSRSWWGKVSGGRGVAGAGAQFLGVAGWVRHRRGAEPGRAVRARGNPAARCFSRPGRSVPCRASPAASTGVDDAFARAWGPGVGAEIMGRGKFGAQRGPWPDQEWNGWWGDNPPFHTPVFVLTHHARPAVAMDGGTTFHFLDASPAQALAQARQAAAGGDVRIGGGPSTVREFLAARPDRLRAHRGGADRAGPRGAAVGGAGGARRPLPNRGGDQPQRRHPRHLQPPVTDGNTAGHASAATPPSPACRDLACHPSEMTLPTLRPDPSPHRDPWEARGANTPYVWLPRKVAMESSSSCHHGVWWTGAMVPVQGEEKDRFRYPVMLAFLSCSQSLKCARVKSTS